MCPQYLTVAVAHAATWCPVVAFRNRAMPLQGGGRLRSGTVSARWVVPVGAVVLAMATAVVMGSGPSEQRTAADPAGGPTPPAPTLPELVPYDGRDFSVGYPRGWQRMESPDPQVALVAADGRGGSLLARVSEPGFTIGTRDELEHAQRFTDRIVTGGQGVELLARPAAIELSGLPGWYYFYTFEDEASRERGVHAHYFLFDGPTMFSLVFQALPAERFVELAPTFDTVAASFIAGADPSSR